MGGFFAHDFLLCANLRVDDSHHATLTMIALRAIEPNGFCVVDDDGVGW